MHRFNLSISFVIYCCMMLINCGGGSESDGTGDGGSQDIIFERTFGGAGAEHGIAVLQASDGGYILLGDAESMGHGGYDIYLIKTDSSGQRQWEKTFGGVGNEYGAAIAIAPDAGFIIVGDTHSFGSGGSDIYLIKTDSSGNEQWSKTIGDTENDFGESVQATTDGYIVLGTTNANSVADMVTLIKTNAAGDITWSAEYGDSDWDGDKGVDVLTTASGGFVVLADGKGISPFFSESYLTDFWLFETDVNGVVIWSNKYGSNDWEHALSLAKTKSGGDVLIGESNRRGSCYLVNTDSSGMELWSNEYEYSNYEVNECYDVLQTPDGGFAMLGDTLNQDLTTDNEFFMYLVESDPHGNKVRERIYKGIGEAAGDSIIRSADGNYILVGSTFSGMDRDIYLLKVEGP
jgi:hypothetical protein